MSLETTPTLPICAGFTEQRLKNMNCKALPAHAAIVVHESVRAFIVSLGYHNDFAPIIKGFARESAARMLAIVHPLLTLLAWQELAQQVTYMNAENAILRSKLPDRFTLNNQERRRLVRHGKKLGPRIKELISIVSNSTFRRWIRTLDDGPAKRPRPEAEKKPGRPWTDECIADTIIRIRKETL